MKDYIIIALIQSILMLVLSFVYVFFVEIDKDEKRHYHDNGKKVPLEWLRDNENPYHPIFEFIIIIIPYIITNTIAEDFMGITGKITFYIIPFSYVLLFLIYPLTTAIYNYFKKRGKLKYKKFDFGNETDNSNNKDS